MSSVQIMKNPMNALLKKWCGPPFNNIEQLRIARIAEQELKETKLVKKQALEEIRIWIDKNDNIRNVRNDEEFLLRFLRAKKFNVALAEEMLLNWICLRKIFPELCRGLDCMDNELKQIIDNGYIFVSPVRDAEGRRVIFYNVKKFDACKYGSSEMARVHFTTYETLLESAEDQVLGFTHVADCEGLSANLVTKWSPSVFAKIVRQGERSTPMRHKEIHLINVPKAVKYVYNFAKSKMSPKLVNRMMLHSDLYSLHRAIRPQCLPKEYGGIHSTEKMITEWKNEMIFRRCMVATLDKMEIIDHRIRVHNNDANDLYNSLPGSFRKLEVD